MHLFYTPDITGDEYTLNAEESKHCVRVLRLAAGEPVVLVDGRGTRYDGVIDRAEAKGCRVRVTGKTEHYGARPFRLHLAIAPTKNIDRIEWMAEKCTEMGIDEITLLNTEHSERKAVKTERLEKVLVAAMKQSLKACLPKLNPMTDFGAFVKACDGRRKFIAHCREGEKRRIDELYAAGEEAVILIGPEGDFSAQEVELATRCGFAAVTLGTSRLRTETAGIVACHTFNFLNKV